jgi:uncharacterized protein YecE (DUF72 family)
MPRYRVGTSGYNYPEWKGSFYPEKCSQKKMLPYYAERLDTVEINYTFYRLPTERLLAGWSAVTPAGFRITLKAPRRITHEARLTDCAEISQAFCDVAETLGDKLGALLFQLPPSFRKNVDVLARFLDTLRPDARAAFEFRHASWHDPAVTELLAARGAALCVADSERMRTPVHVTARHGYFRLRDQGCDGADLARWAETITRSTGGCEEVYVYFKHEERGAGPDFARRLLDHLAPG